MVRFWDLPSLSPGALVLFSAGLGFLSERAVQARDGAWLPAPHLSAGAEQRAQGRERELRGPQLAKLGSGEPLPGKPDLAGKLVSGGLDIAGATALILDQERKLEPEVLLWGGPCTPSIPVTTQENTDRLPPQIIPKRH